MEDHWYAYVATADRTSVTGYVTVESDAARSIVQLRSWDGPKQANTPFIQFDLDTPVDDSVFTVSERRFSFGAD